MSNARFQDQVVWVTGASSGIGRATATAFAGEGAFVIISARRAASLEELAATLGANRCLVLPVDVVDADARNEAVRIALAWKGKVDVLVNNAGVSQRSRALDTTEAAARAIMDVNFFAPVELSRAVLPSMIARQSGQIVVVSSVTGHVATPMRSTYAASKHAVQGYFDALRAELHDTGVDVTIIAPGFIATDITKSAVTADGSPLGKMEEDTAGGMPPDRCAAELVDATAKRKREALIGGKEIYAVHLKRLAPGLVAKLIRRAVPK